LTFFLKYSFFFLFFRTCVYSVGKVLFGCKLAGWKVERLLDDNQPTF
jgi:hypothetical protein